MPAVTKSCVALNGDCVVAAMISESFVRGMCASAVQLNDASPSPVADVAVQSVNIADACFRFVALTGRQAVRALDSAQIAPLKRGHHSGLDVAQDLQQQCPPSVPSATAQRSTESVGGGEPTLARAEDDVQYAISVPTVIAGVENGDLGGHRRD
jgi:hypothetical protein